MKERKIFLICPVRQAGDELQERIAAYVALLESRGAKVHWPPRDTEQNDPTGYGICATNFQGILDADEVHIWYVEESYGSKFDMGGVFMIVAMLGWEKKIVLVNKEEVAALEAAKGTTKSFFKVFQRLIAQQSRSPRS